MLGFSLRLLSSELDAFAEEGRAARLFLGYRAIVAPLAAPRVLGLPS